jgi:hypothetical protein
MARAPGDGDSFNLSPRARRIAGWLVAALIVGIIAVVFRVLGGNGDGTVVDPSPSGPASAASTIRFGTALDESTGEVAADAESSRFTSGDEFVYSVAPGASPPPVEVYVEVQRIGAEPAETVQEPVDDQDLPNPAVIAFSVPTEDLLAVFGPGEYRMLIYADPEGDPIAEGTFELMGSGASPATSG